MFKLAPFAALGLISLAVIPVVRSEQHVVIVGGPGILKYDPPSVNAAVGDTILFTFKQKNHTATQSTLASPCISMPGGFDSNFIPVPDTQTDNFPVASLDVKDTNPIWVYCRQANHCEQGMVFAVNPGDKLAAFQAAATGNATSTSASTSATAAPSVVTVTATVTVSGSTWTTTYGSYPGSAAPTSASTTDHRVTVGANGQLVFSPSNITAQQGDTVTFEFHQKNHSATMSTFAAPCVNAGGFDSGFMPVLDSVTDNFPTYQVTVNDTKPVWVYCKQANHCGQGMVFSINAVEPNSFAAFQAKAKQINGTSSGSPSASGSGSSPSPSGNGAAQIPLLMKPIVMLLVIVAGAFVAL